MIPEQATLVITGTLIQTTMSREGCAKLQITFDAGIAVDANGTICAIVSPATSIWPASIPLPQQCRRVSLDPLRQWIMPGFVDLHYHAPQLPLVGCRLSEPLDSWLQAAVPLESRCANQEYARNLFQRVVHRTLSHGSTSVAYFGSVHVDASRILAETCAERGQRAWIGKVAMDQSSGACACDSKCECVDASAVDSISSTKEFVEACTGLKSLITPVITPRFVPACSPALLDGLGKLAKSLHLPMQTHAWEGEWQVGYGIQYRDGKRDFQILDEHGLLDGVSILAHCVHANQDEIRMMAKRRIVVAHCPLSNAFFADGIMPCREMLMAGVLVGLGTDVGGAPSSSVLCAMRQAVVSSAILEDGVGIGRGGQKRANCRISPVHALWMGTIGGALALGADTGGLQVGKAFDAIIVDTCAPQSNIDDVWDDSVEDRVSKFIMLGDDRNIRQVYVAGRCVIDKDDPVPATTSIK